MLEKLKITGMAQALAAHSGARLGVIARNVANADTPGYRAMDLPDFAAAFADGAQPMRTTRPGHVGADPTRIAQAMPFAGSESPNGNAVSLEQEMVKGVAARQSHEMALTVYRSVSDILRLSLGRGR